MDQSLKSSIAIYALFFTSCLTLIDGVSRLVSFGIFGIVFASVLIWAWQKGSLVIAFQPSILAGTMLVWFALIVGFLRAPSADGFLRLGAFVGISGFLLFGFSSVFTLTEVYRSVAWVAATFVIIGLPTTVLGPLGPIDVWQSGTLFGVRYFIPMSLFDNPNTLGAIAAMGGVGAVGEFLSNRSHVRTLQDMKQPLADMVLAEILAGLCAFGVVLSTGRGAMLALLAGVSVLLFIFGLGRGIAATATLIGGVVFTGAIAAAAGLIPGPSFFQSVDLSGRGVLWRSIMRALGERPLFGYGPGAGKDILAEFVPSGSRYKGSAPHSSYLRMFFVGGLVGGIGYLVLCLGALQAALANATRSVATTSGMLISIFLLLVFNGATIFGLNPVSIVGALTVGFVQSSSHKTRSYRVVQSLPTEIESAIENSLLLNSIDDSYIYGEISKHRNN